MDNIVEPGGGWISGPMVYNPQPTPAPQVTHLPAIEPVDELDISALVLVDEAYAALTSFGEGLDRRGAWRLFSMWRHRDALTAGQRVALLKRFPSRGDRDDR